jgi:hypothetical protein
MSNHTRLLPYGIFKENPHEMHGFGLALRVFPDWRRDLALQTMWSGKAEVNTLGE